MPNYRIITRTTDGIWPIEFKAALRKTPVKHLNTTTEQESDILLTQVSPAFKLINSDLGTYLTLPKTPERKGKRNAIRMPFAITSEKYKSMFKKQIEKKESELIKKDERKKKREEAKAKKATSKHGKQNKQTDKTSATNVCKTCSRATKTTNRVVCDM